MCAGASRWTDAECDLLRSYGGSDLTVHQVVARVAPHLRRTPDAIDMKLRSLGVDLRIRHIARPAGGPVYERTCLNGGCRKKFAERSPYLRLCPVCRTLASNDAGSAGMFSECWAG